MVDKRVGNRSTTASTLPTVPATRKQPRKVRRRPWSSFRRLRQWLRRQLAKRQKQSSLCTNEIGAGQLPPPDPQELKALSLPKIRDVTSEVCCGPSPDAPRLYPNLRGSWQVPPPARSDPRTAAWQFSGKQLSTAQSSSLMRAGAVVQALRSQQGAPSPPLRLIALVLASQKSTTRFKLPVVGLLPASDTSPITPTKPTITHTTAAHPLYPCQPPQPEELLVNRAPLVRYLNTQVPRSLKSAVSREPSNAAVAKRAFTTAQRHSRRPIKSDSTLLPWWHFPDRLLTSHIKQNYCPDLAIEKRKRPSDDRRGSLAPRKRAKFTEQSDVYNCGERSVYLQSLSNRGEHCLTLPRLAPLPSGYAGRKSNAEEAKQAPSASDKWHPHDTKTAPAEPTVTCLTAAHSLYPHRPSQPEALLVGTAPLVRYLNTQMPRSLKSAVSRETSNAAVAKQASATAQCDGSRSVKSDLLPRYRRSRIPRWVVDIKENRCPDLTTEKRKRPSGSQLSTLACESLLAAKHFGLTSLERDDTPCRVPVVAAPPIADLAESPPAMPLPRSTTAGEPAKSSQIEQLKGVFPPDHIIASLLDEAQRHWEEISAGGSALIGGDILKSARITQIIMQANRAAQSMAALSEASSLPAAYGTPVIPAIAATPPLQSFHQIPHHRCQQA